MDIPFIAVCVLTVVYFFITFRRIYVWKLEDTRKRYDIGAALDIGKSQIQMDAYGYQTMRDSMMAVIADGEGKELSGKVAAQVAVRTFTKHYNQYDIAQRPEYFFRKVFKSANANVINALKGISAKASVACVILEEYVLSYAIAGCIYIYVFRNKELILLSRGQVNEELIKDGLNEGKISKEAAKRLLFKDKTYSHIGRDDYESPLMNRDHVKLKKGDSIVMTTGGINKSLSVRELEDILIQKKKSSERAKKVIETIQKIDAKDQENSGIIIIGV